MELIKSMGRKEETKVCPSRISAGLPTSSFFAGCGGGGTEKNADVLAGTEARKCFPSIVAPAGENSL